MTRRTNQGGSIVSFVVIGVILVAALIGALYLVNRRGQEARKSQEIATSETQKSGSTSKPTQSGVSNNTTKEDTKPEEEAGAAVVSSEESNAEVLPSTGTDFSPGQLVGVFMLSASAAAYLQSRRRFAFSL